MTNQPLKKAFSEYSDVENRYIEALKKKGLKFESKGKGAERLGELRAQLLERGVISRNAGASLSIGYLSPACVECTGNNGSETFSTTFKCHRDCYFCFNHNQPDYQRFFDNGCPWEETVARSAAENESLAVVGITGGEPLLDLDNVLSLLEETNRLWPKAHKRMYTSGDLLTRKSAQMLVDAGLDEIRFSVKDDDPIEQQQRVLDAMKLAREYFGTVMVEMPVIPGALDHMKKLFRSFDEVGIDGINLLEFCFPFCNWEEFEKRGFKLKNPPFDVMYDYGYSGGLAVDGSEETILELMLWALDNDIHFGMHYCSLDNKHRSEIHQKNEPAAQAHPCIAFDEEDFFLKTGRVYGPDIEPSRSYLEEVGCDCFVEDDEDESLSFPPRYLESLVRHAEDENLSIEPVTCFMVCETDDEGSYLTDVALRKFILR